MYQRIGFFIPRTFQVADYSIAKLSFRVSIGASKSQKYPKTCNIVEDQTSWV
jgi:hypothetical protein